MTTFSFTHAARQARDRPARMPQVGARARLGNAWVERQHKRQRQCAASLAQLCGCLSTDGRQQWSQTESCRVMYAVNRAFGCIADCLKTAAFSPVSLALVDRLHLLQ